MPKARQAIRLLWLFTLLVSGLVMIMGRLFWMQILATDRYLQLASVQRERRIELSPKRGAIYDRNGSELAVSMEMQTIFANPKFVLDPKAAAAQIAPLIGADQAALEQKMSSGKSFVYLARKIDPEAAKKVKALALPGIDIVSESKRSYPSGKLAAHVVGFVGADNEGLGGLEDRYDHLLQGLAGEIFMERDPNGRPIPGGNGYSNPSVAGDDLVLTIDKQIQFAAEQALERGVAGFQAKGGTIIVMRPGTGEVLAMANYPWFDPNEFGKFPAEARRNRALTDMYEPGSANKVITAAAAIESGVIKPGDMLKVPDNLRLSNKTFHDAHAHKTLDLSFAEVIQQSSNIGTIKVALNLGRQRLYDSLVDFGYGRPTGLDFPGEAKGILPKPENWWETSMGTIPIGQGVAVTPMQIMSVFSTVANDGVAVQPKLLAARIDSDGRRVATQPSARRRVIESETARQLTRILIGVTDSSNGTGSAAAIKGYQVAGKTGTAQKPLPGGAGYGGYIASFIGYVPAGMPALVVGVMLDEPTPIWGGVTAAPLFKEVTQFALRHLGIGPGPVLPSEGTPLPAPGRSGDVRGVAPDTSKPAPVGEGPAD